MYAPVVKSKVEPFKGDIRNYINRDGYTKKCGTPTNYMVQLEGSKRWYRVRNFCVSNSGTLFVKTKDNNFLVVASWDLDKGCTGFSYSGESSR